MRLLGDHEPHQFAVELLHLLHVLGLVRLVLQTLGDRAGQTALMCFACILLLRQHLIIVLSIVQLLLLAIYVMVSLLYKRNELT